MKKILIFFILICFLTSCLFSFALAESTEDKIMYFSNFDGSKTGEIAVYSMDSSGQNISLVLADNFNDLSVSKNKQSLVFGTFYNGLWIYNLGEEEPIHILESEGPGYHYETPELSKDNKLVLFQRFWQNPDNPMEDWNRIIFLLDLEKNKITQLTNQKCCFQPSFSPDEKQIVYVSDNGKGMQTLCIMNLVSKKIQPVITLKSIQNPSFAPDGKKILFNTMKYENDLFSGEIYTVNKNGTGLAKIYDKKGYCYSNPSWSNDGTKIVFLMFGTSGGDADICTAKIDGSDFKNLTNNNQGGRTYFSPEFY